jgi:hypothetical protein
MKGQFAVTAAGDLYCARLRRLLAYWQSRRRGDALPGRADMDPLDLGWILGDVSLVEVHPGSTGPRFRFRLVGSRVAARFGFDPTGRWLEDFPGDDYPHHIGRAFAEVAARAMPFAERPNMVIDGMLHNYEILRLPLAADGRRVDMLMIGADFSDEA